MNQSVEQFLLTNFNAQIAKQNAIDVILSFHDETTLLYDNIKTKTIKYIKI